MHLLLELYENSKVCDIFFPRTNEKWTEPTEFIISSLDYFIGIVIGT